jgi:AraC family transcriptional regulator
MPEVTKPDASLSLRTLARTAEWTVSDVICSAGPGDPAVVERFQAVTIAAVIEGSFRCRGSAGDALLYPGAVLLGNQGACFECGHEHVIGDRCVAFHYAPAFFEEIAASAATSHRFRFTTAALPAAPGLMLPLVRAEAAARDRLARDELAVSVAERVLEFASGEPQRRMAVSARDHKRISTALRHIEAHADEALDLDGLAAIAVMSKFHFLRCFRHVVGATPYNYLLDLRLRHAAVRLSTSEAPVASVAFESGFGDLSTFNARFRTRFGRTPTEFRRAA